jgi:intergrase/recombinase
MYFDQYEVWLNNFKVSEGYRKNIRNLNKNIFSQKFRSIIELKQIVNTEPNIKYKQLAIRNWIKFIEEYEIVPFETILEWKSKIKINTKSNVDSFIPTEKVIKDFLEKVNNYDKLSYIFLKILLESGLRVIEAQLFITNLNMDKFEVTNKITTYPLFHIRGTKSSFYVFLPIETYNLIFDNFKDIKIYNIEKLKTWIKRNKLIPLKYTRKYNFTKLIKSGVSLEVANFIQGRVSQNIGFNHYLAKKELALKEYEKILFKF